MLFTQAIFGFPLTLSGPVFPTERPQCSAALSSLSLMPSSTWLYKWGPCSYQGYQIVWNLRTVRVRAAILSSRRLRFTPLRLYFTRTFYSCAFISFSPQWAYTPTAEGTRRKETHEDVVSYWGRTRGLENGCGLKVQREIVMLRKSCGKTS